MNTWYVKTIVKGSDIEGDGQFAVERITKDTIVLHIDSNIYRNENNSFVNHSLSNNIDWDGANSWIANKDIEISEEITMNYKQWITCKEPLWLLD